MNVYEYAEQILFGGNLEDKLLPIKLSELEFDHRKEYELPKLPGRNKKIQISEIQAKFPKRSSFHLDHKKAEALHFFANHELLAIEMMAAAILQYKFENSEDQKMFIKGLVKTILDEQKHLKLYAHRMNEWGLELGDLNLNDFFWTYMPKLKTPSMFYSAMAMTFESANLDFAKYYSECFLEVGDEKTSKIMETVYIDELSHVALGARWLNLWRGDKTLWQYYVTSLPELLTPNRAKGIHYKEEYRIEAGLDLGYCKDLTQHQDDFSITKRKSWNG